MIWAGQAKNARCVKRAGTARHGVFAKLGQTLGRGARTRRTATSAQWTRWQLAHGVRGRKTMADGKRTGARA